MSQHVCLFLFWSIIIVCGFSSLHFVSRPTCRFLFIDSVSPMYIGTIRIGIGLMWTFFRILFYFPVPVISNRIFIRYEYWMSYRQNTHESIVYWIKHNIVIPFASFSHSFLVYFLFRCCKTVAINNVLSRHAFTYKFRDRDDV